MGNAEQGSWAFGSHDDDASGESCTKESLFINDVEGNGKKKYI